MQGTWKFIFCATAGVWIPNVPFNFVTSDLAAFQTAVVGTINVKQQFAYFTRDSFLRYIGGDIERSLYIHLPKWRIETQNITGLISPENMHLYRNVSFHTRRTPPIRRQRTCLWKIKVCACYSRTRGMRFWRLQRKRLSVHCLHCYAWQVVNSVTYVKCFLDVQLCHVNTDTFVSQKPRPQKTTSGQNNGY